MSLLTICQDAADQIGIERPQVVFGGLQSNEQLLLRLANKVGRHLAAIADWPALRSEAVLAASGGTVQANAIPADFLRFIPETFWNRAVPALVSGPVGAVEWARLEAVSTEGLRQRFTRRGSDILVRPAPSAGEALAFGYISAQWVRSAGGVPRPRFEADDDVSVLDEETITLGVVYEFLETQGQPSALALAEYQRRIADVLSGEIADPGVLPAGDVFAFGSRHFDGVP